MPGEPPGPATSIRPPAFEKYERAPFWSFEATVITFSQLAGEKASTLEYELPAATTTTLPLATAVLIASCVIGSHEPPPPRLMLITSAGLAFIGTPGTVPPEAQTIASAMSEL